MFTDLSDCLLDSLFCCLGWTRSWGWCLFWQLLVTLFNFWFNCLPHLVQLLKTRLFWFGSQVFNDRVHEFISFTIFQSTHSPFNSYEFIPYCDDTMDQSDDLPDSRTVWINIFGPHDLQLFINFCDKRLDHNVHLSDSYLKSLVSLFEVFLTTSLNLGKWVLNLVKVSLVLSTHLRHLIDLTELICLRWCRLDFSWCCLILGLGALFHI